MMLAAMYSEVGRFPDAAQTARRAFALASGQTWDLAHHMGARIYKRYRFYKKELQN